MSISAPKDTEGRSSADLNEKPLVIRKKWRKKFSTEPWTIKENYDLVKAVNLFTKPGSDTSWSDVSEKLLAVNNAKTPRSKDWYTPERCADQYEFALQEYGTILPEVQKDEPRLIRAIRFLTAEHQRIQEVEFACNEAEIAKIKKELADLEAGDNDDILEEWEQEFLAELESMRSEEELIDQEEPLPKRTIVEEILDMGDNIDGIMARIQALWEEENKCSYKDPCANMKTEALVEPVPSVTSGGVDELKLENEVSNVEKLETEDIEEKITGAEKIPIRTNVTEISGTEGEVLEITEVPIPIDDENEAVVPIPTPTAKADNELILDKNTVEESVNATATPNEKQKSSNLKLPESVKESEESVDIKPDISTIDIGIPLPQEKTAKLNDIVPAVVLNKETGKVTISDEVKSEEPEKIVATESGTKTNPENTLKVADIEIKIEPESTEDETVDESSNLKEKYPKTVLELPTTLPLPEPSKRTRKSRKSEMMDTTRERRTSSRIQPPPQPTNKPELEKEKEKVKTSESDRPPPPPTVPDISESANDENKKEGTVPVPATVDVTPDSLKVSDVKIEINDEAFSRSTCSSPAFSDINVKVDDEQNKVFKKSILLLHARIRSHKNASLFHKPIKEENARGYHRKVLEPMDLSKIRKRIESGQINSIEAYERDITVMLLNATMFNSSKSNISILTQEMAIDVWDLIEDYRSTQQLLQLSTPQDSESGEPSPVYPIRRTRRRDSSMTIVKPETIVQKLKKSSGRLTPGTSSRRRGISENSDSVQKEVDTSGRNRSESLSVTGTELPKPSTPRKRTGSVSDKGQGSSQVHGRTFRHKSGSGDGDEVSLPTIGRDLRAGKTPQASTSSIRDGSYNPDTPKASATVVEHSEGTESGKSEKITRKKRRHSNVQVEPGSDQETKIKDEIPEGEVVTQKSGLKPGQTRKSRRI